MHQEKELKNPILLYMKYVPDQIEENRCIPKIYILAGYLYKMNLFKKYFRSSQAESIVFLK